MHVLYTYEAVSLANKIISVVTAFFFRLVLAGDRAVRHECMGDDSQ